MSPPATRQLLSHLEREIEFLNLLVDATLKVRTLLRPQRPAESGDTTVAADTTPPESQVQRNERTRKQLEALQRAIEAGFPLVAESRNQFSQLVSGIPTATRPRSLNELRTCLDPSQQSVFDQLQAQLRSKLNEFHSITQANQTAILYSLDFYERLLGGSPQDRNCYDASGKTDSSPAAYRFLRTNC